MDPRRNSGAYDRSNLQYDNFDQRVQQNAGSASKRQSFSARTGHQQDNQVDYFNSRALPQDSGALKGDSRRMREPQAALHVPQTRRRANNGSDALPSQNYGNSRSAQPLANTNSKAHRAREDVDTQNSPISPRGPRDVTRGTVPGRSPLQKLEGKLDDISKEEKRARMEEAEHQARQRATGDRAGRSGNAYNDRSRHVSDGNGRRTEPTSGNAGTERRHVSAPLRDEAYVRQAQRGSTNHEGHSYEQPTRSSDRQYERVEDDATPENRFRRASEALRDHGRNTAVNNAPTQESGWQDQRQGRQNELTGVGRSNSNKDYRHRSRDAGFAGAATAAGMGMALEGAEKRREERRDERRRTDSYPEPQTTVSRGNSKKSQRNNAPDGYQPGNRKDNIPEAQTQLQAHRAGTSEGLKAAVKQQDPDPLPPSAVRNPRGQGPTYQVPPQTAGAQQARDQVGFGEVQPVLPSRGARDEERHMSGGAQEDGRYHKFSNMFHKHHDQNQPRRPAEPALEEWRKADTLHLTLDEMMRDELSSSQGESSRWEPSGRRGSGLGRDGSGAYDGSYEEEATTFRPPLYLKCGPLLRYTGMRRERRAKPGRSGITDREIWRGSVMIVTMDAHSSYERIPTLRLFSQPMDVLPRPPTKFREELPQEYVDPLAGQVKLGRTGEALYVKPVDTIEEGIDLSRVEDDGGLFERSRLSTLGSQTSNGPNGQQHSHMTTQHKSRVRGRDGEKAGKYREIKAARLYADRGVTFWRFNLEIELGSSQARVAYRINGGPAIGFWVPSRHQSMNIMFHSCNGFSLSVDPDLFSGPDPLWRDVLSSHQMKPFHVMLGGGDQIYNDAAMRDTDLFREWLSLKTPEHKHRAEFTPEMQDELEEFYLDRYSMWFSQGLFSMANSQIPMVNIWDDHDIIDVSLLVLSYVTLC